MIITAVLTLGLIGFTFAVLLAFLSKKLKVETDPKVDQVNEILPNINCGACGFSGCNPFAEAVVKEGKLFNGCLPGGSQINEEIAKILGITATKSKVEKIVVCRCQAEVGEKKISTTYKGPKTCKASHIVGGAIDCTWGCLGFGDCVKVCPTGALVLKNKRIEVIFDKCIGCGNCVTECPRDLFEYAPFKEKMKLCYVACSNNEKVLGVKAVCSRGCIGCTLCTKVEDSPYEMKGNLSYVKYPEAKKIESLQAGKNKCPTKCIFDLNV